MLQFQLMDNLQEMQTNAKFPSDDWQRLHANVYNQIRPKVYPNKHIQNENYIDNLFRSQSDWGYVFCVLKYISSVLIICRVC